MLAVIEVPKHGLGVLAAGGTQRTVRRHGHCVQVTVVTNVVGLKLAVGQVPDLKECNTCLYHLGTLGVCVNFLNMRIDS